MKREQVMGIVRHSLTFIGGLLVMSGVGSPDQWMEIVGSGVALVGAIWSIVVKVDSAPVPETPDVSGDWDADQD
jgi:hypothetical protein